MAKRFFIQILIVSMAALLFSSLYYYAVCQGLRHTKNAIPGKLNFIFYDSSSYDAVFLGSSRALRNINPLQFDSITGIRSYNAGIDGANLTLMETITKSFVKHHHSKYIFINLDPSTMEKDSTIFYFPQLFPYICQEGMYELIHAEPKLKLGKEYPFLAISYIDDDLKGAAFNILPDTDPVFTHRGFMPIASGEYHGDSDEHPLKFNCDANAFNDLDSLCAFCMAQHCRIYFIMAPIYRATYTKGSDPEAYYPTLRSIESKYGIREMNFYTDKRFDKSMYYTPSHMNELGARLYTSILADSFDIRRKNSP